MSGSGGGKSRTDGQSTKPSEIQWMLYNMFTCRLVSWKWQEDFRFHFQWDKAWFCSKWILLRPLAEGLIILGKAKYKEEAFCPVLYPPSGLWQRAQPSAGRTKFFLSFSCSLWLMSRTIHPIHNHASDFLMALNWRNQQMAGKYPPAVYRQSEACWADSSRNLMWTRVAPTLLYAHFQKRLLALGSTIKRLNGLSEMFCRSLWD